MNSGPYRGRAAAERPTICGSSVGIGTSHRPVPVSRLGGPEGRWIRRFFGRGSARRRSRAVRAISFARENTVSAEE